MSIENHQSPAATVAPSKAFGDQRVFFVHDGARCGESGLAYEQSSSGPLLVFIADDVPDTLLAKVAVRHGLVLDERIEFRDQFERDLILATAAAKAH